MAPALNCWLKHPLRLVACLSPMRSLCPLTADDGRDRSVPFVLCLCPKGPGKGAFEKKDSSLEPKLFRSSPVKMDFLIEPGDPWPAGNIKWRSRLSAELFNFPLDQRGCLVHSHSIFPEWVFHQPSYLQTVSSAKHPNLMWNALRLPCWPLSPSQPCT